MERQRAEKTRASRRCRQSRMPCLRSCRPAPVLVPRRIAFSLIRKPLGYLMTQSVNLEHTLTSPVHHRLHFIFMSVRLPETLTLHSAQSATLLASRPRRNFKGTPVNLACNECRRRKVKVCQSCLCLHNVELYNTYVVALHPSSARGRVCRMAPNSSTEYAFRSTE